MNPEISRRFVQESKNMKDVSFDIYQASIAERDPQKALDMIIERLAEFKVDVPSELLRDRMEKLRAEIEERDSKNLN
jgi:hypothetical protein